MAAIINREVEKFNEWWHEFAVRPVISALMNKANHIRATQLNKALKKLPPLDEEQLYSLEKMTEAIVRNLLKSPINKIKENAGNNGNFANAAKDLFQLEIEDPQ